MELILLPTQVLQDCGFWAEFKVSFVSLSSEFNRKFWACLVRNLAKPGNVSGYVTKKPHKIKIMSKMFDSLKRQVGRDAGKVVSNFVFGDSHSTPHRNTNAQNRANVNEINQKRLEIQQQDLKQKDLYLLDGAVINAVNQVIAIDIPNNEKEITKILQELEIQLKVNKWLGIHSGETAKIRNKFPDAVLTKYEQCVYELKYIECNPERLNLATKTLSKYKKIRFVYKYKLFLSIFVFLFLFTIVGLNAG